MANTYKSFRREDRPNGVTTLVLDGEGPVNTLSRALTADFEKAVPELEQDPMVKAIVLFSGKKDNFIAGADLEMLKAVQTAADGAEISRNGKILLDRLEASPKPWVAAIHGSCLGGGLEVALACRYRVASEEKPTQLGLPETQLGLLPGGGGTQRLPRLVGIQGGLDLILTGRALRAKKAQKLGLVDEVVPRAILRQVAEKRAAELADGTLKPERGNAAPLATVRDPKALARLALEENPVGRRVLFQQAKKKLLEKTRGNYPAPERALEAVRAGFEKGPAGGAESESLGFGELTVSPVAQRLIEIFFAQTALKKDTGVDAPGVAPRPVGHVSMLGGGLMGGGIAYVTANAGIPVRFKDRDDAGLGRGLAHVQTLVDERVKKKSLTRQEGVELMSRLTGTTAYDGMKQTDVFIEAVFEDLALKRRVLADVEALAKPTAVFASNTSSLPIGQIAAEAKRPENVVGMHYFSPVNKMPLLEVIRAPKTSPEAIATVVALGKKQGKTVIVVKDGPGFYTTRILAPYIGEAGFLLSEGASVETIDQALVDYGFPVGPLQLLDEVGIDVASKIAVILEKAFGKRMAPPPAFEKLHADGRAGRKNKKGFYTYDGKDKKVDESVYAAIGTKPKGNADRAEIVERLSLQMINEAAHSRGEGILRSARDGDIGAIFGLGFPPFRGGPFHAADAIGAKALVAKLKALEAKHGPRFAPAPLLVEQAEKGTTFYGSAT